MSSLVRPTQRAATLALVVALALTGTAACSSSSNGSAASSSTVATGSHLDPAAFESHMTQAGTILVDVRTPTEFAAGHIQGATNVDVESAAFATQIAALDKSKTYALYCHSGRRSGIALAAMQQVGFTHVYDLQGGIQNWTATGRTLVTGN
jgi:phage shock protein E